LHEAKRASRLSRHGRTQYHNEPSQPLAS